MASADIESLINDVTRDPQRGAPGLVYQAIDRNGNPLNAIASGVRSLGSNEPMTMDTTFWIASCTKMVTAIALMQLVERNKANLDSADQLESVVPELKDVRILEGVDANGHEQLRTKKNRITLRMLQTHTCRTIPPVHLHTLLDLWLTCASRLQLHFLQREPLVSRIRHDTSRDECQCTLDSVRHPLEFEPGTYRLYGVGIDWVGVFIERVSGLQLGAFFQKHIFSPLGMTHTAFIPSPSMRSTLAGMHARHLQTCTLRSTPHIFKTVYEVGLKDADVLHSGGAGLVSTAPDYCQLLAMFLNDGTSPTTHARILQPSSVDDMFTNHVPDWESVYAHNGFAVCREDLVNPILRKPPPVPGRQGWGLNFLLLGDPTVVKTGKLTAGMGAASKAAVEERFPRGAANGVCNCYWSVDRERGVGGILLSQILPFADPVVMPLWERVEEAMYGEGLKGRTAEPKTSPL